MMRCLSHLSAALALISALPSASAMEPWEMLLREQLQRELGCRVIRIAEARQFELAGEQVIDGHADCEDGRAYDFTRPKLHMKFELRPCSMTVC